MPFRTPFPLVNEKNGCLVLFLFLSVACSAALPREPGLKKIGTEVGNGNSEGETSNDPNGDGHQIPDGSEENDDDGSGKKPGNEGAKPDGTPAKPDESGSTPKPMVPDLSQTPGKLFQIVGILGNGQSLSVGAGQGHNLPPIKTPGPFLNNLKLIDSSGKYDNPKSETLSLAPLTEPFRPQATGTWPQNIFGQTFHGTMSQTMSELSQKKFAKDLVSVHSVTGVAGAVMDIIRKNGSGVNYQGGLFEARAIQNLAAKSSKTFGFGAIVLTHGESDWATPGYGQMMLEMYNDYNRDLQEITRQKTSIPLLVSQQSSFPLQSAGYIPEYISTQTQWLLSADHPGKIYTIGPKYQYSYLDGVHLTAEGYEEFGKKAGEVYFRIVELKEDWAPLQPTAAKATSTGKIRVSFHVPDPPLKFDSKLPLPHQSQNKEWALGKGFELVAYDGSKVTISDATIEGNDVVLSTPIPTQSIQIVRYAMTQDGEGGQGGTGLGRIGLLQDSDTLISQPNFAVSFSMPIAHGDPSELTLVKKRVDDFYFRKGRLWTTGDIFETNRENIAGDGVKFVGRNVQYSDDEKTWMALEVGAGRLNVDDKGILLLAPDVGPRVGIRDGDKWGAFPPLPLSGSEVIADVAGRNQNYWAVSRPGRQVFKFKTASGTWEHIAGNLSEIDVDSEGSVWGIDMHKDVYQWTPSGWRKDSKKAVALSIGDDDSVWIIQESDRNVYRLDRKTSTWTQFTKNGGYDRVAAGSGPLKFYVSNGGSLYKN